MGARTPAAPAGLGLAGRALWKAAHAEFVFHAVELALLTEVCHLVDRLAAIQAELATAPLMVEGSTGQPRVNPLLGEARAQQRVLDQLARGLALPLPDERVGRRRSPTAKENAMARWAKAPAPDEPFDASGI